MLFVRSPHGRTPRGDLWSLDVDSGLETLLVDTSCLGVDDASLPAAERARRERLRESGAGLTAYDICPDGSAVVFALGGQLHVLRFDQTSEGSASEATPEGLAQPNVLKVPGPVVDPRAGATHIAWNRDRSVWVCGLDGTQARQVTPDDGAMWGLADFIAAEELDRLRGFWWSPDGQLLLVARVDDSAVPTWWISDPSAPESAPTPHKYPAAGSTNASVSLWLIDTSEESTETAAVQVLAVGPGEEFEYLAAVTWSRGEALAQVLTRDQRRSAVLAIDPADGVSRSVAEWTDDAWVDVVAGTPAALPDGRILTVRNDTGADTLRLYADGTPISPTGVLVRSVVGVMADGGVILRVADAPETSDIIRLDVQGTTGTLTDGGWFNATWAHGLLTCTGATLSDASWRTHVHRVTDDGLASLATITSGAESAGAGANPQLGRLGNVRFALLLPSWIEAGGWPRPEALPLLLLPYGGPHAQRVMAAGPSYTEARWWAERGYAVLITDGVGTPGVSPSWERGIHGDFATHVLADQVRALDAVLADQGDLLDGERVGIMGWSFGGYLAALAVLDRPDRFHAAVAGAPVTDWRLYDTGYTERYLGDPNTNPAHYEVSDLVRRAAALTRPLLLIHGLADDNVVAAHTLRLSGALLAAGRPHSVLPLTNVTHMTPQPVIAANLLRTQATFLDGHLHPNGLPERSSNAS
jgi:dipeptidyl-peptidase-4